MNIMKRQHRTGREDMITRNSEINFKVSKFLSCKYINISVSCYFGEAEASPVVIVYIV